MTDNEKLLIEAARKILPDGFEIVPVAPQRRKAWAVIAKEKPCGQRNGYAYLYDKKPENPGGVSGIGTNAVACIEIEFMPGDGL